MFSLFGRSRPPDNIGVLYGMIVAQARLPCFYSSYRVPDTVNGRFDLIVLHLALVIRRLAGPEKKVSEDGQALFDRFCRDMDDNLREIGIADLKVPKEMRKIGEAYFGRAQSYEAAIASGDEAMFAAAIARNIYDDEPAGVSAGRLTRYAISVMGLLERQSSPEIAAGQVRFPDPLTVEFQTSQEAS